MKIDSISNFATWLHYINRSALLRSETGLNHGIKSQKKLLSERAPCEKAVGGIYFTKKWRAETLQPVLEFDNFKPRLESCILNCIPWLNGPFFGGWWLGFSERGSQGLSNGTNVASQLAKSISVFTRRPDGLEVRRAGFLKRGPAFKPPNRGTFSHPPLSNFPSPWKPAWLA